MLKRLDGFDSREIEKFYAAVFAEETKIMAVASKELDELDGESYARDVIKNNLNAIITSYGLLFILI